MNVKVCEIMQQCDYISQEAIDKGLTAGRIKDYAYIYHVNDVKEDGTPVSPHVHIALRLKDSYDTKYICKWFGVPEQCVSKVKGRWVDMLKYLTHANAPTKHQYNEDEVISNFDWKKDIEKSNNKKEIDNIIEKIEKGEIREYNQFEEIDIRIWARNKRVIENALLYYKEKIYMDKDREIKVLFFSGLSGVGKTSFAKKFCKDSGKSFCVSSSSNDCMQDYKGEDVLILDDLRDDTFKFVDLLKVLDNHTKSTVSSRYNNKCFLGDTIIITSYKPLEDWYREEDRKSLRQLHRRISECYKFTKDKIFCYVYSDEDSKYEFVGSFNNPISLTPKKQVKMALAMCDAMGLEFEPSMKERIDNALEKEDEDFWKEVVDGEEPFEDK